MRETRELLRQPSRSILVSEKREALVLAEAVAQGLAEDCTRATAVSR